MLQLEKCTVDLRTLATEPELKRWLGEQLINGGADIQCTNSKVMLTETKRPPTVEERGEVINQDDWNTSLAAIQQQQKENILKIGGKEPRMASKLIIKLRQSKTGKTTSLRGGLTEIIQTILEEKRAGFRSTIAVVKRKCDNKSEKKRSHLGLSTHCQKADHTGRFTLPKSNAYTIIMKEYRKGVKLRLPLRHKKRYKNRTDTITRVGRQKSVSALIHVLTQASAFIKTNWIASFEKVVSWKHFFVLLNWCEKFWSNGPIFQNLPHNHCYDKRAFEWQCGLIIIILS